VTKTTLGKICTFNYGKALPASERSGSGFSVYGSNGIVGQHGKSLTTGKTIIIGRKGSYGEINYSEKPCWPIDTAYFIDESCTNQDIRWLSHRLATMGLNKMNKSAAVPGLNREDAYRLELLLPSISEQRRIAAILDQADALRAKRREALAELDGLAQAIFVEMFGDPIFNPKNLPLSRLSDVGSLDRGVSKHRPRNAPELLGGSYPLIQTGDVANCDGYIREHKSTYSEFGLRQSKLWPKGTLCITIAANIAKTGILMFDACFPDSVVGFSSKNSATIEFVRVWLTFLQKSLEDAAPESAQKNINLAILRDLRIPEPALEIQQIFAARIQALESLKATHRTALTELDALFASLQHRAFRGEL
jgi:type I restriction enzyme, S subunit